MRRGAALLLAALLLGGAVPAPPPARPVPTEENFTLRVADRFRAALPGSTVTITEPLALTIDRPGESGGPMQVFLGRIFNICRNEDAEICEQETANFIRVFVSHIGGDTAPGTRAQLRVAVRHRDYCTELDRMGADRTDAQRIIARPLAPDLCEVLMFDYPDRMRGMNGADLPALSMDADAAWALGRRQALDHLPALSALPFDADGLAVITDYEYIPTLLLAGNGWRALAASRGPLMVAVPADEMMIVAPADRVDHARFRALVADLFRNGRRQISEHIYRWTETGWVVVED